LQIKKVCEVQFFAWIGWFPFLFYITTYIGDLYFDQEYEKNPNMTEDEITAVLETGTRVGTGALLIFAVTTFAASVVLPFIIPPTYSAPEAAGGATTPMTPMTPGTPGGLAGSGYFSLKDSGRSSRHAKSLSARLSEYGNVFQIRSLTLRRSWFISHIMFTALMVATFFVRGTTSATVLVGLIGIPWALTNWAPFALLSSEISKRDAIANGEDDAAEQGSDQAGVILGIHNVAIAAPQVIATLFSSIIFKFLQKPRGTPNDNSVAWVLRFGGLCALVAAWLTLRVHEDKEDPEVTISRRRRPS
jgi:solute carrier family 45 protein 1/2/4